MVRGDDQPRVTVFDPPKNLKTSAVDVNALRFKYDD